MEGTASTSDDAATANTLSGPPTVNDMTADASANNTADASAKQQPSPGRQSRVTFNLKRWNSACPSDENGIDLEAGGQTEESMVDPPPLDNATNSTTTAQQATTNNIVSATTTRTNTNLPRLVSRNLPFHQSSNKINIRHNLEKSLNLKLCRLLSNDWFHAWLRLPTLVSIFMLTTIWTTSILLFALVYVYIDNIQPSQACGLGAAGSPIAFSGAFAFSLETCTTVGYGLPNGVNAFFEHACSGLQAAIYVQMLWSMMFNAFLLSFIFNRLGRSEARGVQVVHSQRAILSLAPNQQWRFQVRLYDLDARHPVVEAHVRLYAVLHARPVPRPLRLLQPDDELGATLLLSFPTTVSHAVDAFSLLYPTTTTTHTSTHHHHHHHHMTPPPLVHPNGLTLRQADAVTGNRDDYPCPICGDSYGTYERWKNHVQYQQIVERQDDFPVEGTHQSLSLLPNDTIITNGFMDDDNDNVDSNDQQQQLDAMTMIQQMKEHFRQEVAEVICVVEGIDPLMSGTFQSLHSYRFEDIVFAEHAQFAPCLQVVTTSTSKSKNSLPTTTTNNIVPDSNTTTTTTVVEMDMTRFHQVVVEEPPHETTPTSSSIHTTSTTHKTTKPGKTPKRKVRQVSRRMGDALFGPTTTTTTTALEDTSFRLPPLTTPSPAPPPPPAQPPKRQYGARTV